MPDPVFPRLNLSRRSIPHAPCLDLSEQGQLGGSSKESLSMGFKKTPYLLSKDE